MIGYVILAVAFAGIAAQLVGLYIVDQRVRQLEERLADIGRKQNVIQLRKAS